MPFGLPVATPRITTGNVRTTYDLFTPAPGASTPGPTPAPFGGLANPLGTTFTDVGGPDSVSGTLTQLPLLSTAIYRYVLYKSATNPALIANPGVVSYTDNTFTIVSGAMADGVTATASDFAGYLMPNTTDLSALTATILNNGGNGSGVWICVGGFVKAARSLAAVAVGDTLVGGGTGSFIPARVASATAATFVRTATALTAVSSNASDVVVNIVPLF
jgi:hypothetical protein